MNGAVGIGKGCGNQYSFVIVHCPVFCSLISIVACLSGRQALHTLTVANDWAAMLKECKNKPLAASGCHVC